MSHLALRALSSINELLKIDYRHGKAGPETTVYCLYDTNDISEQSDYPRTHMFFLTTSTTGLPKLVISALEEMSNFTTGMSVRELMTQTVSKVRNVVSQGSSVNRPVLIDEDTPMPDVARTATGSESEDDWDEAEMDSFVFDHVSSPDYETARLMNRRIRQDVRLVKNAGFKVGVLVGMKANSVGSILSISIQVSRLVLSEEVLQAWDLQNQQYLVLLIRYLGVYKTLDTIIAEAAGHADIKFYMGVGNRYKPTAFEALIAFDGNNKVGNTSRNGDTTKPPDTAQSIETGFRGLFISSSLNPLLNTKYLSLLKIRSNNNLDWDGAQHNYQDRQGRFGMDGENDLGKLPTTPRKVKKTRSKLETCAGADHLKDSGELSFPLLSMQFALRHLVHCTEFCLVCHIRIKGQFEALKPYVCSKPLCLYQYMALGYGPNIEHEIVTQPYVVDLLISFCYSSAENSSLREYPSGLSLSVPAGTNFTAIPDTMKHQLRYNADKNELMFNDASDEECPVKNGDWIMVKPLGTILPNSEYHFLQTTMLISYRL